MDVHANRTSRSVTEWIYCTPPPTYAEIESGVYRLIILMENRAIFIGQLDRDREVF